jgi:hypothetical protein
MKLATGLLSFRFETKGQEKVFHLEQGYVSV